MPGFINKYFFVETSFAPVFERRERVAIIKKSEHSSLMKSRAIVSFSNQIAYAFTSILQHLDLTGKNIFQ